MNNPEKLCKKEYFVSLGAILKEPDGQMESFLREAHQFLDKHFSDYEIVLIDYFSDENHTQWANLLLKKIPSIRILKLNVEVDDDVAFAAILENCIGDFVVLFTPGMDPIECIDDLVQKCQQGIDVIVGVSKQPQTMGYRLLRPWIQWVLDGIGYKIPRNATTLRCLSRRAVNAVTQTGRFHHQFFVRIANTGYPTQTYHYKINKYPAGIKTLPDGIQQGIKMLVFNSTKPLRWMSVLGFLGSFLAFLIVNYSIVIRFIKDDVIEGWTTTVLFMSVLFMILFIILAFFGEYLGRLLDDRSEHRDYNIVSEMNSSVMLREDRINILDESE